jgi:hypothetical protein
VELFLGNNFRIKKHVLGTHTTLRLTRLCCALRLPQFCEQCRRHAQAVEVTRLAVLKWHNHMFAPLDMSLSLRKVQYSTVKESMHTRARLYPGLGSFVYHDYGPLHPARLTYPARA